MNTKTILVAVTIILGSALIGISVYSYSEIGKLRQEIVAQDREGASETQTPEELRELEQVITENQLPTPTEGTGSAATPESTPEQNQVMMKVKLYYKNTKKDPSVLECNADAFVYREIPLTKTPLRDTITLLLVNELTSEEVALGLVNQFDTPDGEDLSGLTAAKKQFRLVSASIVNGVATLKFEDPANFSSGGSCRVGIMMEQIRQTAKQFPSVKDVVFLPDLLFQP